MQAVAMGFLCVFLSEEWMEFRLRACRTWASLFRVGRGPGATPRGVHYAGHGRFCQALASHSLLFWCFKMVRKYPFVKGAIINEVGMLNCAPESLDPICAGG